MVSQKGIASSSITRQDAQRSLTRGATAEKLMVRGSLWTKSRLGLTDIGSQEGLGVAKEVSLGEIEMRKHTLKRLEKSSESSKIRRPRSSRLRQARL